MTTANKLFGCNWPHDLPVLTEKSDHVPENDPHYAFHPKTTEAILAGFAFNRRVLIQGLHGTGKTTHIEQVANRLNWPVLRINLDGYITRSELIGRDSLRLKDGKQITEFKEGLLPWALRHGVALIFDEYDAGKPDVLFVIQRVLEAKGKLTLLDQNEVIEPHPNFRLFATNNTLGLGDAWGLYHGTQVLNQGQMDRWDVVAQLNYLPLKQEMKMVIGHVPEFEQKKQQLEQMLRLAELVRQGFRQGDLSTVMSPRNVMSWAKNCQIFGDIRTAFDFSFKNKADSTEHEIIDEYDRFH